ncbi:ligand-binding protein SH3 [Calothrix sp. HK-06]|nr:ligand-binding protein SH3 [Calothrix sp. HK-06]
MLKALIASALILTAAVPAIAQQVGPGVGGGYEAYVCTNDVGGRLSLRSGPGQGNRVLTQIPAGNGIRVLESTQGRDGFTWMKVSYGRRVGWVRSDFVCVN